VTAVTCTCCGESFEQAWVTLWSRRDIVICYTCLDYLNGQRARQIAILDGLQPLAGFDPVFSVRDVARAIDHYERLGFTTTRHDDGYAFATWGNLTVHLARDEHPDAHKTSVLYVHVDDAGEVAARWRGAGLEVEEPENQDYGKREGRHIDPDGNVIRFGGPPR
jgi:catechol 2,3-dioxygenase-like lactoylglutathione lyase family enzyme